jgi:hypothetical protein
MTSGTSLGCLLGIVSNTIRIQYIILFKLRSIFYEDGNCFGELAMMNSRPRAASIMSLDDSVYGILDIHGYESSVLENDKQKIRVYYIFLYCNRKEWLSYNPSSSPSGR